MSRSARPAPAVQPSSHRASPALRQAGHSQSPAPPATLTTAQKLAHAFPGQPLYNEHGPSNRLVLSLASGLGSEVDFALDRLLRFSQVDLNLLQPDLLPGLVEALCDTISNFDQHHHHAFSKGKGKSTAWSYFISSPAREAHIRRAAKAALVLRNIACEPHNLQPLWDRPQVLITIITVLDRTAPTDPALPTDAPMAQDTSQLRLMLLDILSLFAPYLTLQPPTSSSTEDGDTNVEMMDAAGGAEGSSKAQQPQLPPLPEEVQPLLSRVYPLVVQLCWSSDRAMILSAYYILAALATTANASTFTFPCHADSLESTTNPVARALQLLPLADMELISATLQFLFCYTDISSKNADSLASRSDVAHILKQLLNKSLFGGTRQDLVLGGPAPSKFKPAAQQHIPTGPGLLPAAEMRLILAIPEPQRTSSWCQWMYVLQANSEIKQTALWNTYRDQFGPFATDTSPLPSPGDYLNMLRGSFDRPVDIVRSSTDNKTFVVRGIQERDRSAMVLTLRKHWSQQGMPQGMSGNPSKMSDEDLLLAALKSLLQKTNGGLGSIGHLSSSNSSSGGAAMADPSSHPQEVRHALWHPKTADSLPAGHALYAILVLRNLSRAIRAAALPSLQRQQLRLNDNNKNEPSESTSTTGLSYLTPFGETDDDPTDTYAHGAGQAKDVLLQMEETFLMLAVGARAFAPYLTEILSDIAILSSGSTTTTAQ